MNDKLVNLMADLKEDETIALVKDLIKQGTDPLSILDDARVAMEAVGKRFEKCEYFIPDLMMAGEILKGISDIVKPLLTGGRRHRRRARSSSARWQVTSTTSARTSSPSCSTSPATRSWTSASTSPSTSSSRRSRGSNPRSLVSPASSPSPSTP